MKLKKCILAKVLAATMLCESLFGFALTMPTPVYAAEEDGSVDNTGEEDYPNVAEGKAVKTSSADTTQSNVAGSNAVDGKDDTKWVSVNLRTESPQWLQIDLGETRTTVGRIEVKFDGAAWDQGYEIQTYDTEKNAQRHTVKTVGANGPSSSADANEKRTDVTDTITRNDSDEKIVLRRYVNFSFSIPSNLSGSDEKKVSVAEIRIFGKPAEKVHGPSISMVAPEADQYPEPAKVFAPAQDVAVRHTTLADRTTPGATLIRKGTGTQGTEDREVEGENAPVQAPLWTDGTIVQDISDAEFFAQDGTYGFNVAAQTPGTLNKFDVWGTDVKIISFQLYLKKTPNGTKNIFGKGNKYAMQIDGTRLYMFMHNKTNGWPEEAVTYASVSGNANDFLNKWHDVLFVVDGVGNQRLYVDGVASTTARPNAGNAIAPEIPNGGLQPFSFGYNLSDGNGSANLFTSDDGAIARFKFYTTKDYHGVTNGAGMDISDSAVLSSAFDNSGEDPAFSIAKIEQDRTRNDGYKIITNMLQKEQPTARISLCPYSRATVWSKKTGNTWTEMAATEKFAADTKYKATTRLIADDGFIFDESCIQTVTESLEQSGDGSETARSTAKISNKERELTIVTYYGCEASDVEDTCHIDDILLENDPIHMTVGDTDVPVGAEATGIGVCANHSNAKAELKYTLSEGADGVTLSEDGKLTATKSTKGILGYAPVTVTVTATLKDASGNTVQSNNVDVTRTRTVSVQVDPQKEEDAAIEVAPTITVQAPVATKYPEVANVSIPKEAKHFEDIADRMNPAATLEPLTKDYINNSMYITTKPTAGWTDTYVNEPVIKNVDGVWAFNAQGQTPGDTNKFDVFGRDIKLVSFKLFLKKWPTNPTQTISVYGKGNKYALQVTSDKKLIMFMHSTSGWPQEDFAPENPDDFLEKWHNIFMVVDGKGWQRLYVDGVPSVTAAGRPAQGGAFAQETTGAQKKPFSLGYNSNDDRPNWWGGMFTKEYGYIADFEFYSDKNYDNIINGSGTDISEAQVLDAQLAENIDLEELERKYGENVGIVLTNMLQESNATANITVTPYVAKTNWSQETEKGSGQFELIDKKTPTAFGYVARYRSTTTLTAFDGFVFKNEDAFKKAVQDNFYTTGGAEATEVTVNVKENAKGEENKVLEIIATYDETEEAPCTCEIDIVTPPAPVSITIPESAATGEGTLAETTEDDVVIECLKEEHPLQGRVLFTYGVKEGDEDKIDFDLETRKITAKKAGTAKITLTAEFQTQNESGTWETYVNENEEEVTVTKEITVTVTKEGAASQAEKSELSDAANDAKADYPASLESDYEAEAWQALQTAIAEAEELAANPNATSAEVAAAKQKITDAIANLADHKSAKGKAKDALKGVLDSMKAEYDANNSDKKYTDASWKAFTDAYKAAMDELATADAARLGALKTALETAKKNLVAAGGPGGPGTPGTPGTEVKDGQVLTGPDGTYQVASAKDKTVVITKGKDAKNLKVQSVVTINKVTYKVVGIGSKAFANCKKARKITIGDNVTSIGANAFSGCSKATQLTLGKSVKSIGKKAFYNCKKLKKVTIKGKALSTIGKQAFQKTAKKVTVKWPKGLKAKQKNNLKKKLKKAKMKVK